MRSKQIVIHLYNSGNIEYGRKQISATYDSINESHTHNVEWNNQILKILLFNLYEIQNRQKLKFQENGYSWGGGI